MKQIAIVLPNYFVAGAVAGTIDLFHFANRLAQGASEPLFGWRLLSETGQAMHSSTGLPFAADGDFDSAHDADAVIVPGFMYEDEKQYERTLQASKPLVSRLRDWHDRGKVVAASCTGVSLLAESGVLNGKPATISWWLSAWFRQRYPAIQLKTHAILTECDTLLCGGATTSYLNLALRLVERFAGADLALHCAQRMLVDMHRASQAPYTTLQQYTGHNDPIIARCQQWLQDHLAHPFRLDALAAAVAVSERTLMRRFRLALGDTPLHYLQQMRLSAARRLLENSALGLEQIVAQVGYSDVSTFRRLFKRELQCSPAEYRRRFAGAKPEQ